MPTTRGSRRAAADPGRRRLAVGDALGLDRVPLLHALQSAELGGLEALAFDGRDVHHDGAVGRERLLDGRSQLRDVVAVDDADVGEVELLPEEAGRPEGLDRLLELRPETLERRADAGRQFGQRALGAFARLVELRVHAHAVEVAAERADVGRDAHAVVVEDHDDRRTQAAGVVDRLEGDAAGHRAVADHGYDLAVFTLTQPHGLLEADRV